MFKKRSHSVSGPSSSGTVVMEGVLEKKKTFGLSRFHCMLREGKLWYSEDKVSSSRGVDHVGVGGIMGDGPSNK